MWRSEGGVGNERRRKSTRNQNWRKDEEWRVYRVKREGE